jgi:hypothetical protein
MYRDAIHSIVVMFLFFVSICYSQEGLRGRVVDNNYQAIQGALVKLISADKSQTTDWEGKFFIEITTSAHILRAGPAITVTSFQNGILSFNVSEKQFKTVRIEIFDKKGQRVNKIIKERLREGAYHISILPDNLPVMMYFVKLQIGNASSVYKVLNLKNRKNSLLAKDFLTEKSLSKRSTDNSNVIDTLEVTKDGYQTAQVEITSYTNYLNDIVLQSDVSNDEGLPPVVNGQWARTTRYWDCCKPHCGWHSNMRMCDISGNDLNDQGAESGCMGGPAFQCWDYAPIEINSKVSYGWTAFNNMGTQCGECFQLDFQGALQGKQMIVQVINIGDGGSDAFDLLIPGGGVGALNGCSRQWNNADLGVQYGGFHSSCGDNADCIRGMCEAAFGDKEDLMRGCEWYINWFQMTSNPEVTFMKTSCPQEIKDISHIGN